MDSVRTSPHIQGRTAPARGSRVVICMLEQSGSLECSESGNDTEVHLEILILLASAERKPGKSKQDCAWDPQPPRTQRIAEGNTLLAPSSAVKNVNLNRPQ